MRFSWAKVYQLVSGRGVQQGPFRGMNYITACVGSALWPKMLGTYEIELAPCIEEIVAMKPDVIVNAGAAEGYYTVGLALRCHDSNGIAFEMTGEGRKLIGILASRNKVSHRIKIKGTCDAPSLGQALVGAARPALIMDVEGAESELLNPAACPALLRCVVLVEAHEQAGVETSSEIERQFAVSHDVQRITSTPRIFGQLPWMLRLIGTCGLRRRVMTTLDEGRGGAMTWLWLKPKTAVIHA